MIFGRRYNYPLPKVPANVRTTFNNMCGVVSEEELKELTLLLEQTMEKTRELAMNSARIDLRLAEEISSRCRLLLEHYDEFTPQEQAFVIGAVRYFVVDDDPFSDDTFASGFDDDAQVINHVLEHLGIEGMYIELL
jgi:hypothetical protein